MGELDKKQKVYFEDPKKFADVWNALVYEGKQVVSWEGLRECSPVLVHAEGGRKLDKLGLEVLGMLVSSKRLMKLLNTKKEKEELTMCKAIDDIYEEGREAGIREGKEEMCKAIDDIYEEGREKGIRE